MELDSHCRGLASSLIYVVIPVAKIGLPFLFYLFWQTNDCEEKTKT